MDGGMRLEKKNGDFSNRVSWQLLGINVTVVHFSLQTELLKGAHASLQ